MVRYHFVSYQPPLLQSPERHSMFCQIDFPKTYKRSFQGYPTWPYLACRNVRSKCDIWPIRPYLALYGRIFGRTKYGQVGVSLKRSCKMKLRCIEFVSIGPQSQSLWPNLIFAGYPHCNYNVKLQYYLMDSSKANYVLGNFDTPPRWDKIPSFPTTLSGGPICLWSSKLSLFLVWLGLLMCFQSVFNFFPRMPPQQMWPHLAKPCIPGV